MNARRSAAPRSPVARALRVRPASPALAALLVLSGCTVGPDHSAPQMRLPAGWVEPAPADQAASEPQSPNSTAAPATDLARWWTTFRDPILDGLIARAITDNLDLRQARLRVLEARAARGIASGALAPTLDAAGNYERSRQSENTRQGRAGGESRQDSSGADHFQAGFDASWELDVFGGLRRGVEAADADLDAAVEDHRDVLVSLLAETARTYADLRTFQARMQIARSNLQLQEKSLEIARVRFQAGLSSELDVQRAESILAGTRASIPVLESGVSGSIYALSLLLGREPGTLVPELTVASWITTADIPIPAAQGPPAVGLPSDLLRRRPDIRRAERQIAGTSARIGVATADLFPRFSLTGSFGLSSSQLGQLPQADSRFWSIGPAVRWPIFQGGRLRANVALQEARHQQAIAGYEKTVLAALAETETALADLRRQQERRVALAAAVAADRRASELASELYTRGLTDFISVLDTQRQLLLQEDALAETDRAIAQSLIAVYKSLGGGWDPDAPSPEQPHPQSPTPPQAAPPTSSAEPPSRG